MTPPSSTNTALEAIGIPALPAIPIRSLPARAGDDVQARVLHLINGEHYSGAERVQDLLAQQLPSAGFHVAFAALKPGRFGTARESRGTSLVELPMRGRLDPRVVRQLVELIDYEGHEIIHAHTPRTALVGSLVARRTELPFIYHVHSPATHDSTRSLANWANGLSEKFSLRRAERLIAVSRAMRDHMIRRGFRAERIVCVPNGVPHVPRAKERRPPSSEWTLGCIALFRPRKGLEVLLEALSVLRSRGLPVRLRAVGAFETPSYEDSIRELVERLNLAEAIEWIGFTRDVTGQLSEIDLFVLPSLFGEGLPMVVLEAMASGLPIVASHVAGVDEAVRHRKTGLLVEPGSVSQLATGVEEFLQGAVDYGAMSRAALTAHNAEFSDTTMAGAVASIYREVLAETRARTR